MKTKFKNKISILPVTMTIHKNVMKISKIELPLCCISGIKIEEN